MIGRCDIFFARVLLRFKDYMLYLLRPSGRLASFPSLRPGQQVGNGHESPDKLALCPGLAKL
jgi:hypothetical protein